ncbi:MAG: hypothetical protein Q9223_002289 [Gallowayella weberi]
MNKEIPHKGIREGAPVYKLKDEDIKRVVDNSKNGNLATSWNPPRKLEQQLHRKKPGRLGAYGIGELRERATRTLEDTHAHISGEAEYQRGQFMKVAETQEAKKLAKMYLYHSSRWQSSYLQSGSLNHLLTLFNNMKKYLNANSKLLHQLRMSCIIRTRNAKLSRPNSSRSQRMQPADTVWAPRSSGKHRLEESDFESPQERKSKQQKSGFDSVLSPRDGEIDDVPRAADFEEPVYKNQLYLQALTKWALKPAQKGRDGLQHTSRQTRLVDMCRNDGSALKRDGFMSRHTKFHAELEE